MFKSEYHLLKHPTIVKGQAKCRAPINSLILNFVKLCQSLAVPVPQSLQMLKFGNNLKVVSL